MRTIVDDKRVWLVFKCPDCGAKDSYPPDDVAHMTMPPPCYTCGTALLRYLHTEIEEG